MAFIVSPTQGGVNTLSVPGGYTVLWDSGSGITESVPGEQGPTATVKYRLYDKNDRYSFVQQLLGQWTGTPPSSLLYTGPFQYPPSPNLICTSVPEIRSFSKASILPVGLPYIFGRQAIVTAVFTRPVWQAATNGGYFSIDFNGNGEILTIPETSFTFTSTGAPTNTPVGAQVMGAEINVTRYRMPFLPDTEMIAVAGCINNQPFQIGNVIYAAGTLLFGPGASSTQSDPLGNITYQCQYKFLFKYPGWNYYINPSTGQYDTIQNGSGDFPYPSANFNLLP